MQRFCFTIHGRRGVDLLGSGSDLFPRAPGPDSTTQTSVIDAWNGSDPTGFTNDWFAFDVTSPGVWEMSTKVPASRYSHKHDGSVRALAALMLGLVPAGLLGNALLCLLGRARRRAWSSFGVYLRAMCLLDSAVLMIDAFGAVMEFLPDQLVSAVLAYFDRHTWPCTLLASLYKLTSTASAWLMVAVSLDRLLAVRCPLRRADLCTASRARTVLLVILVSSVILTAPACVLLALGPVSGPPYLKSSDSLLACSPRLTLLFEPYSHLFADGLVRFLLPFLIISCSSMATIHAIYRRERRQDHFTGTAESTSVVSANISLHARKITQKLVTLTMVFLATAGPLGVFDLLEGICDVALMSSADFDPANTSRQAAMAREFLRLWAAINYVSNFYLFVLGSRELTTGALNILRFSKTHKQNANQ